jgi:membrane associated rhomboid family serine protease
MHARRSGVRDGAPGSDALGFDTESREEWEGRQPVLLVPWPTTVLLAALAAGYIMQTVLGRTEDVALHYGFATGDMGRGLFSTLFTYQFLHGGMAHLVMNALFALALGPPVARLLGLGLVGGVSFFAFYLFCGAAAALGFAAIHPGAEGGFLIGASGAISGLFGAATRLLGRRDLAPLTDRRMLSMAAAITLVNVVVGLIGLMPGGGPGPVAIAWEAHLAGYATGLLLIGPWSRVTRALSTR